VKRDDTLGNAIESEGISEDYFMGGGKADERSFILENQKVAPLRLYRGQPLVVGR